VKGGIQNTQADITIIACGSANVLTLHPRDEKPNAARPALDSHRRLDLASHFSARRMHAIGLQETKIRNIRGNTIADYSVISAAAAA
jgi:hypothetical protein